MRNWDKLLLANHGEAWDEFCHTYSECLKEPGDWKSSATPRFNPPERSLHAFRNTFALNYIRRERFHLQKHSAILRSK